MRWDFLQGKSAEMANAGTAAPAAPPPASVSEPVAAARPASPTASTPALASSGVGSYMRAAGPLKLREEPDPWSLELGTVVAGELVRVEEVSYSGSDRIKMNLSAIYLALPCI